MRRREAAALVAGIALGRTARRQPEVLVRADQGFLREHAPGDPEAWGPREDESAACDADGEAAP